MTRVLSPTAVTDKQAAILIHFAALPSSSLTDEQREAFLAGARALEHEARARAFDRQGEE